MSCITLKNITIRNRDKFFFKNTSLQVEKADNLLVVGANGSGKTTLVKAITGVLPVAQGEIILNFLDDPLPYPSVHKNKIAYISFDAHKKIYLENEFKKDIENFTGKSQEVLNLSTGQIRKLVIEKALAKNPRILILDEPFDGLDINSRKDLKQLIEKLAAEVFVILVTHRSDEVVKGIKKAILVKDGRVEKLGKVREVLAQYQLFNYAAAGKKKDVRVLRKKDGQSSKTTPVLIDFKNVSVEFNGKRILDNINWEVNKGENWAILGPNGAGKSTLIKLITGENLQVFANQIKIFGKLRNEIDIEEINKKISIVSADLSLRIPDYQKVSKIVLDVKILKKLGIMELLNKQYGELSFGQKRLVLIAKAINNNPKILILDEPCHGLDSKNKTMVLNEIGNLAKSGTNIILITHHSDEIVAAIKKVMYLQKGKIEKIADLS